MLELLAQMARDIEQENNRKSAVAAALWTVCQDRPNKEIKLSFDELEKVNAGGIAIHFDSEKRELTVKAVSKEEALASAEKHFTNPDSH